MSFELWPAECRITPVPVDGRCTIDIIVNDDEKMGKASYRDLSIAAKGLLQRCVAPSSFGGIAMNVGKYSIALSEQLMHVSMTSSFLKEKLETWVLS